jgi:hypothetical protein
MCSSLELFPEFAGIIYMNYHYEFKICTLASFVALGMRSEGNAPENGEPTVGFSFTTMLQNTGLFSSSIS